METFESLYNSVIRKLPFSIIGYSDLDERINDFFDNFSEHFFLRRSNKFSFISYSFVKLSKIETWDIDDLGRDFFFNSFKDKYTEIILGYYYYLKKINIKKDFEEESEEKLKLTVNFLSEYFSGDVGYRVGVNSKKIAEVSFLQSKNTIDITLPNKIFKIRGIEKIQEIFHEDLFLPISSIQNLDLGNSRDEVYRNLYRYEHQPNDEIKSIYLNVTKKLFNEDETKKILEDLKQQFRFFCNNNRQFFRAFKDANEIDNFIGEWVKTLISVATISVYYNSFIEYMPSICGVFQKGNNIEEKRNLGGLIVAYSIKDEINNEERALFRLVGDRITAIIAGQYLYDKNRTLRQNESTRKIQDCFDKWVVGNGDEKSKKIRHHIFHDELALIPSECQSSGLVINITDVNDEIKKMTQELKANDEYKKYLSSYFLSRFEDLKTKKRVYKDDLIRLSKKIKNTKDSNVFSKYFNDSLITLEYFNVPLFEKLLGLLLEQDDRKIKMESIQIKIDKANSTNNGDMIYIEAEFEEEQELIYYNKIKNGNLANFFIDNYDAFHGHFNFRIYKLEQFSNYEELIFDFKKHFQIDEDRKPIITSNKRSYKVSKIRYSLENLLIFNTKK